VVENKKLTKSVLTKSLAQARKNCRKQEKKIGQLKPIEAMKATITFLVAFLV
jgi:hypothetical protein